MGARRDVTVKIAADLAKDAKIVAAFREVSLAEYLSETLRPLVAGDLRKELLERSAEHLPKLELPRDGKTQEASASE